MNFAAVYLLSGVCVDARDIFTHKDLVGATVRQSGFQIVMAQPLLEKRESPLFNFPQSTRNAQDHLKISAIKRRVVDNDTVFGISVILDTN